MLVTARCHPSVTVLGVCLDLSDEDEARAAIEASGKPKVTLAQREYQDALDLVALNAIGTKVDAQAAGLYCEQVRLD